MIPMQPCTKCGYLAAFDAFGNTDHVCLLDDGVWGALLPAVAPREERTIIIESTARGAGDEFYERWQHASDEASPSFVTFRKHAEQIKELRDLERKWRDQLIDEWCERHPQSERATLEALYDRIKKSADDAALDMLYGTRRNP